MIEVNAALGSECLSEMNTTGCREAVGGISFSSGQQVHSGDPSLEPMEKQQPSAFLVTFSNSSSMGMTTPEGLYQ